MIERGAILEVKKFINLKVPKKIKRIKSYWNKRDKRNISIKKFKFQN